LKADPRGKFLDRYRPGLNPFLLLPLSLFFFTIFALSGHYSSILVVIVQVLFIYEWLGPGQYGIYEKGLSLFLTKEGDRFVRWAEFKAVELYYWPGKSGGNFLHLTLKSGELLRFPINSRTVRVLIPRVLPRIARLKLSPDVWERLKGKRGDLTKPSTWRTDRKIVYRGLDYRSPVPYKIALFLLGSMVLLKLDLAPTMEWSQLIGSYFMAIGALVLADLLRRKFPSKNVETT